jgi:hypothetical protein
MIAVCAACHDYIHRGKLNITDEMLYSWKQISRNVEYMYSNLWIEPGPRPQLWFGTFAFQTESKISIIELSPHNRISFEVNGPDLLILDLHLTGKDGIPLIEIRNNTITHKIHPDLYLETAPGQVLLVASEESPVIPRWVINRMRSIPDRTNYPEDGFFVLFQAVVIRPGVAKINTILTEGDRAVVADNALYFFGRTHAYGITHRAKIEGKTIFDIKGQVDWNECGKIFGFSDDLAIYSHKNFDPSNGPVPYNPDED